MYVARSCGRTRAGYPHDILYTLCLTHQTVSPTNDDGHRIASCNVLLV